MQKYSFDIIGTHLDILIDSDNSAMELFQVIETRLSGFESKYSRFISGNWLHILNQERSWILDIDANNMLSKMLEIARKTDGYFDPTIGKRLTELGYGKMELQIDKISSSWHGDYRDIEIVGDRVILHSNTELEFGWVGKGYLIDIIHGIIDNSVFSSNKYLINFGGDMYGRGEWNIGLESPFASDEVIGTIGLNDLFLACSAGTKRKWW
jgi:thiamine biosynthesis lipoprotein